MTHYIPIDAPILRGVAQADCGARVPINLHDSTPECPKCSAIEADLEHGMNPPVVEAYPEPDVIEIHPEPDTPPFGPFGDDPFVSPRVLGFRPSPPPVVRELETLPPEPGSANLVTSLEQAAATLAVVEQSTDVIAKAEAIQVVDADSWLRGIDIFDILRSLETAVTNHYGPHVKRAHEAWNGLTTERAKHLKPIEEARKRLGDRCAMWKAADDQRQKAEQQRRERLAREEQQLAAERAAVQAAQAGEPETAKQILEEAKTAPLPMLPPPGGVSSSKATTPQRWICNVLDLKLLLAAIGRGEFPEFDAPILEALQPILNRQAVTLKGELGKRYPGTEGRQKPSTAGRG